MTRFTCFFCKKNLRRTYANPIEMCRSAKTLFAPKFQKHSKCNISLCNDCKPHTEIMKCARCKNYRNFDDMENPYDRCYECHSECSQCKTHRKPDEMNLPNNKCLKCHRMCSSCGKQRQPDEMNLLHNKCRECYELKKITVICCLTHDLCQNTTTKCCHCADTREFREEGTYEVYVDGVGYVNGNGCVNDGRVNGNECVTGARRNQFYCPSCSRNKVMIVETLKNQEPTFKTA